MTETSRASRAWLVGPIVAAAAYWLLLLGPLGLGTPHPLDDTWEYAVVARSLLAGHGFRTEVIHPPLWSLRDAAGRVPVAVHGPLLPLLLAPPIAALGPRAVDGIAWLGALAAVAAALAIARLGARTLGPPVGAGAALAFTFAPATLTAVRHDAGLLVGAALLAFALDLSARERPRGITAGIAAGLAALARPELAFAIPVVVALARGARVSVAVTATACLIPWWAHQKLVFGNAFFNLSSYLLIGYWGARPDLTVLRDFDLTPARWPSVLRAALPSLGPKAVDFAPHAIKRALFVPSGGTGWLAPLGLVAALRRPAARPLASAALALACLPLAIMTLTVYDGRYLVPFLPLWALGAAAGARAAVRPLPAWARRPRAWVGLLLLLMAPSIAPALKEASSQSQALRHRLSEERALLARLPAARADGARPIFSDTPDFVAWTTDRPAVWVTAHEYARLPRVGTRPHDRSRPHRAPHDLTWFHADRGRGAATGP